MTEDITFNSTKKQHKQIMPKQLPFSAAISLATFLLICCGLVVALFVNRLPTEMRRQAYIVYDSDTSSVANKYVSIASAQEELVGPNGSTCYCRDSKGFNYACRNQALCCGNKYFAYYAAVCQKPIDPNAAEKLVGPDGATCYCLNDKGLNYACRNQNLCCSNKYFSVAAPNVCGGKSHDEDKNQQPGGTSDPGHSKPTPSPTPTPLPTPIIVQSNEQVVGPNGNTCYCKNAKGLNYICQDQTHCCYNKAFSTAMSICSQPRTTALLLKPSLSPSPTPSPSPLVESEAKNHGGGGICYYGISSCTSYGRESGSSCTACNGGICCGDALPASNPACKNKPTAEITIDDQKFFCIDGRLTPYVTTDKNGNKLTERILAGGFEPTTETVKKTTNSNGSIPNVTAFNQNGPSASDDLAKKGCGPTNVTNILLSKGVTKLPNGKPLTPDNLAQYYFIDNQAKYGPWYSGGIEPEQVQAVLKDNGVDSKSIVVRKGNNDAFLQLNIDKPDPKGSVRDQKLNEIVQNVKNGHPVMAVATLNAGGTNHVHWITFTEVNEKGDLVGYDTAIPTQVGGYYKTDQANKIDYNELNSAVIQEAIAIN
jgi:hypothetical protein